MDEQRDGAHDDVRNHQPHVTPRRRAQTPENPRVHLTDDVGVALQNERLHGRCQRRHCDTRKHQRCRTATTTEGRADEVRENNRHQTAEKRTEWQRIDDPRTGAGTVQREDDGCTKARPRRDPQQVGVDERIAKHALVAGPRQRECRAHQRGEHDARHTDFPDDDPLTCGHTAVDRNERQVIDECQRDAPPDRSGRAHHHTEQKRTARRDDRDGHPPTCGDQPLRGCRRLLGVHDGTTNPWPR